MLFFVLCRVGKHDGAVVQHVLNLTVEDTTLDIDILCTGSLNIRTEFVVGTTLIDIFLHQHVERTVGLGVEAEAQALQSVVVLHRGGVDNNELCLIICRNKQTIASLH